MGDLLRFFTKPGEWAGFVPFGAVGIILDTAAPNAAHSRELLKDAAQSRIPCREIDRPRLDATSFEGLRAVLAFDLAPPTEPERKLLREFASRGGLVLAGPGWGKPPRDQAYTIQSVDEGELAVYKDDFPDPRLVVRDLYSLLDAPDFGVTFFNAPSVLTDVSTNSAGDRLAIQMVNYADFPADSWTIWAPPAFKAARLYLPGSAPADLPVKRNGGRTEITIPRFSVFATLILQ
jgi:hypothetical protein